MKRVIYMCIAAVMLLTASLPLHAIMLSGSRKSSPDVSDRTMAALWKDYEAADKADKPRSKMEILGSIKEIAATKHLSWDFWQAASLYRQTGLSLNRKLADSLNTALKEEVEAYNEPVVTLEYYFRHYGSKANIEYVLSEKERLCEARNEDFYSNSSILSGYLSGHLAEYIRNDYEYALWCMLDFSGEYDLQPVPLAETIETSAYVDTGANPAQAEDSTAIPKAIPAESNACSCLMEELSGRYPESAYLEYLEAKSINSSRRRRMQLEIFSDKYADKAVALYAEADLLLLKKSRLDSCEAGESEYRALLEECKAFKTRKETLSGTEAAIVENITAIDNLINILTGSSVSLYAENGKVSIYLRNLPSVELGLTDKDKNTVFSQSMDNTKNSFYTIDTLELALPATDDGDYTLSAGNGEIVARCQYMKYRLSLATREDSRGHGFYVTDYLSGEPVKTVDLTLTKNGKVVATENGITTSEGFTLLPENLQSVLKENAVYYLSCSLKGGDGTLLKSPEACLSLLNTGGTTASMDGNYCKILTDRGAYNPGDSVHFKAILYKGNLKEAIQVAESGMEVRAILSDPSGNEVESVSSRTNDFGSVAGDFILPENLRNGRFRIDIKADGYSASQYFRVDEFVLPSFDVSFESIDRLYLPGDKVTVRGRVRSYSGHPLSSTAIHYTAEASTLLAEGSLSPSEDGTFEITFNSKPDVAYQYIAVTVKVTDATGETLEFSTSLFISAKVNIKTKLLNAAEADFALAESSGGTRTSTVMPEGDTASFVLTAVSPNGDTVPADIHYSLADYKGNELQSGSAESGAVVDFDLSGRPSGLLTLLCSVNVEAGDGTSVSAVQKTVILHQPAKAESINFELDYMFRSHGEYVEDGCDINVEFGSTEGPVWAVAELYGKDRELLGSKAVYIAGVQGEPSSLTNVNFTYKETYPDAVYMQLFYFRGGKSKTWHKQYRRSVNTLELPIGFSSFEDSVLPGKEYSISLRTLPEAEGAVTIYDKSVDKIAENRWNGISLQKFNVSSVGINASCGHDGSIHTGRLLTRSVAGTAKLNAVSMSGYAVLSAEDDSTDGFADATGVMTVEEAAEGLYSIDGESTGVSAYSMADGSGEDVSVREDFSGTLAFLPFLRSADDGTMTFNFNSSDKLSTFTVQAFAHTRDMKNAVLARDMTVTIPVRVAMAEPQYLYTGDTCLLSASVSTTAEKDISGTLWLYQYEGEDYKNLQPVKADSCELCLPAGKQLSHRFELMVPAGAGKRLGLKLIFIGDGYSDGLFVSVPVLEAAQELTESHSAILLPGQSREETLARLRDAFVNSSGEDAVLIERSIMDMIEEAIPDKAEPATDNVLDLMAACYVRLLSSSLGQAMGTGGGTAELFERVLRCRNSDGGFGWFEGMKSSQIITATVLEYLAKLSASGLMDTATMDPEQSVRYLDKAHFETTWPHWCGGLSDAQYMYVRSLYACVPFETAQADEERLAEFKKFANSYLAGNEEDNLSGKILAKARRIRTAVNLLESTDGLALAKAWGVGVSGKKLRKAVSADIESLTEYAVAHVDGGKYFPNAVLSDGGLLENETYAHSLLCDLFARYSSLSFAKASEEATGIAEGVRIWLMVQKETQAWASTPAFVDAINSVMAGSETVKSTSVIILSKSRSITFSDIQASGNGMGIERKFYREVAVPIDSDATVLQYEEIAPGTVLNAGDKIRVEYSIQNQENRSFAKLTAPREAALRPVSQLSGAYSPGISPLRINSLYSFRPSGYRNVKDSCTEYYFDTCPEGKTVVSEDFFVTQSGTFSSPVVEIECLYAPHYRANGSLTAKLATD